MKAIYQLEVPVPGNHPEWWCQLFCGALNKMDPPKKNVVRINLSSQLGSILTVAILALQESSLTQQLEQQSHSIWQSVTKTGRRLLPEQMGAVVPFNLLWSKNTKDRWIKFVKESGTWPVSWFRLNKRNRIRPRLPIDSGKLPVNEL